MAQLNFLDCLLCSKSRLGLCAKKPTQKDGVRLKIVDLWVSRLKLTSHISTIRNVIPLKG